MYEAFGKKSLVNLSQYKRRSIILFCSISIDGDWRSESIYMKATINIRIFRFFLSENFSGRSALVCIPLKIFATFDKGTVFPFSFSSICRKAMSDESFHGMETYSALTTDKQIIFPYDPEGRLIPIDTMKSSAYLCHHTRTSVLCSIPGRSVSACW